MLYQYKLIDGHLHIYSASGLTTAERARGEADGWTFYMTIDRTARADAERLAAA